MDTLSEKIRRPATFLLAIFLWLHAAFLLNINSTFLNECARLLKLTVSEAALFILLLIFTFLASSGFWKTVGSLAYIYFFPFVVLGYVFYLFGFLIRGLHNWIRHQARPLSKNSQIVEQPSSATSEIVAHPAVRVAPEQRIRELLRFIVRPFQRFMMLWCILLLVTTHPKVVWLCLVVVLVHLMRRVFGILKILLFSEPWLQKIGSAIREGSLKVLDTALETLSVVTRDATPTNDLRNLWNQLNLWKNVLKFLSDSYLLSRWAWVLGTVFFGFVYVYFAVMFSFAYYGIARVNEVSYQWTDAIVTSLFVPFFISDLPKLVPIRLLGGIHCLLLVAVGIGTVVGFLRRKLEAIRRAAAELNERLVQQGIQEKLIILEAKFEPPAAAIDASPK